MAQCREAGGRAALKEQRYEDALAHFQADAEFQRAEPAAALGRVVEAMLAEVHRLFSEANGSQAPALDRLLTRVLGLQPECAEASLMGGLMAFLEKA